MVHLLRFFPAFSSTSSMISGTFLTANLNTACPSIWMKDSRSSSGFQPLRCRLKPVRASPFPPSEWAAVTAGGAFLRPEDHGAGAVPDRMHVLRSVQSTMQLMLSAPMTMTVRQIPALIYA